MVNRYLLPLLLLGMLWASSAMSQTVPQGFNYQCIVRDNTGASINNQTVTLLFTIRNNAPNGPIAYSEMHTTSTNAYGLINLSVGGGNPLQGNFASINWGVGAKFLTVSIETAPGVFDEIGTSQLLSVPYALYAQNAANGADNWGTQTVQTTPVLSGNGTAANPLTIAQQGAQPGQVLKWNGTTWVPQNDDTGQPGTVTEINTGAGLTGGPITTSGTISLANAPVTPGVYGGPSNIPVITVDQYGRVVDATTMPVIITSISAGPGISVTQNGQNFTITNIGDLDPSDDITTSSVADGDVTGPFSNLQIKPGVVGTPELADGAVTTPKIADGAVSTAKIADNSVNTSKIANGAVTGAKINDMGANSGQVLKWNGSTWAPAQDAVGPAVSLNEGPGIGISGAFPNFTITNTGDTDPNDDITATSIADGDITGTFTNLQIKPGAVNSLKLANNSVTTLKIHPQAVTGDRIDQMGASMGQVLKWNGSTWAPAPDNVGSVTITGGLGIDVTPSGQNFLITNTGDVNPFDDITMNSIADGDITGPFNNLQLKANVVGSVELADNAVQTSKIQNGAVTGAKIASMAAANGQVLKWNGLTWAPADDLGPDNWGTQTVVVAARLTGNGTNTSPLDIASMNASLGQVLKWNGVAWAPANEEVGNNYAAGTGISITGTAPNFTINNTGDTDNDPTNEIQVLSLSGNDLSLSNGGGTVTLPPSNNYAAGTGISITGTAPNFTINNTGDADNDPTNEIQVLSLSGNDLSLSNGGGTVTLPPSNAYSAGAGIQITGTAPNFTIVNVGDLDPSDDITTSSTAGGDLSGTFDNLQINPGVVGTAELADGAVTGAKINAMGADPGNVLKWDGTTWAPADATIYTSLNIAGTGSQTDPLRLNSFSAADGQVLAWNSMANLWVPADDTWGTQVAQTDATLAGNGTTASPLKIASQGANIGQVLKWNGSTWIPADDVVASSGGDDWGTQSVVSDNTLDGNGTSLAPLRLAQQGATLGQVLKWDGTTWAPADEAVGNNYTAGTGISITGTAPNFTITNTGDADNDPTNEIQVLSLSGNDLSLSNGGGTVTLPPSNTYSAGDGIEITGTAPNFTITNTGDADNDPTNEIQVLSLSGNDLSLSNGGGTVTLPPSNTYTAGAGIEITGTAPNFTITNTGDADNDPTNELQTLSLNGTELKISGTNSMVNLDTLFNNAGVGLWTASGPDIHNANSGNVGVGTATPVRPLHVKGGTEVIRVEGTEPTIGFAKGANLAASIAKSAGFFTLTTEDTSSIVLATGGGKAVFVDGLTGHVAMGNTAHPSARLRVSHASGFAGLMIENISSGGQWDFRVNPLTGALELYNNFSGGASPAGTFLTNGAYIPSDKRLKKDIQTTGRVLDRVSLLQPVYYRYRHEGSDAKRSIGFLAQEVEALFPELVIQTPAADGQTYLAVNYAGFSVLAIKAIQEQQAEIQALRQQNEQLEKRLNALEARMLQLEQSRASADK